MGMMLVRRRNQAANNAATRPEKVKKPAKKAEETESQTAKRVAGKKKQ